MRIILMVFLIFLLTACGFKGPLYLPGPTASPKTIPKRQPQQSSAHDDTPSSPLIHPHFCQGE